MIRIAAGAQCSLVNPMASESQQRMSNVLPALCGGLKGIRLQVFLSREQCNHATRDLA